VLPSVAGFAASVVEPVYPQKMRRPPTGKGSGSSGLCFETSKVNETTCTSGEEISVGGGRAQVSDVHKDVSRPYEVF
jgi:hypothetical protein